MKHLLYIEDSVVTQKVMMRRLEQAGHVSVASTLGEARQLLAQQNFDLVLADVNLPDGNALDLIWELRTRFTPQQLPIIAVSASMDNLLRAQSLQAGANDCLLMPAPWPALMSALERMLDSPYVHQREPGTVAVTLVEGVSDGHPWIYCPELQLRLDGGDARLLRQEMEARIRSGFTQSALPFVRNVKTTECLLCPPNTP